MRRRGRLTQEQAEERERMETISDPSVSSANGRHHHAVPSSTVVSLSQRGGDEASIIGDDRVDLEPGLNHAQATWATEMPGQTSAGHQWLTTQHDRRVTAIC